MVAASKLDFLIALTYDRSEGILGHSSDRD
jgi:hypothetical protein